MKFEYCQSELRKCSDDHGEYFYCPNEMCLWDGNIRIQVNQNGNGKKMSNM